MSGIPSTAVPTPILGPNGFIIPTESAILAGTQSDLNAALGNRLNFTNTAGSVTNATPQALWASSEAAVIGNSYDVFAWYCNMVDPAYSQGRMQDAIARIYYLERNPALPTVVQVACGGLANTPISAGVLVKDISGNLYTCTQPGTIPIGGSITLQFANIATGPIPCPAGALNTSNGAQIYQAIPGWNTITNSADGVAGSNVETPAQFEARRSVSVGWQSNGWQGAMLGAVYNISGVLDAYVIDNAQNTSQTVGGVTLAANSLYACVLGGNAQSVAQAIWSRKMPGCVYNGNTSQIVYDTNPKYVPPLPQYTVTWQTPTIVDFAALVVVKTNALVPSNALTLVQGAIVGAFAGLDGGPRAKIGSYVSASRYYAPVTALGSWAAPPWLVDIQIGVLGSGASTLTASISTTTLTVAAVTGTLAAGQLLLDATGNLAPGTTIVTQTSGSTGSTGTYTVSVSQTVSSEAMTATTMTNTVLMQIDQSPTIAATSVTLALV